MDCVRRSRTRSDHRLRRAAPLASLPACVSVDGALRRVPLSALGTVAGGEALLSALRRDGIVLLTPADGAMDAAVRTCYEACRRFFALPYEVKAAHGAASGPGQLHGYMEYLDDDEGSECFEAKLHHDHRFAWPGRPAQFRAAVNALLQQLLNVACRALSALVDALGLDRQHLSSLLDVDEAQKPSLDLSTCSHTALRVWQYTRSRRTGWHCDNGFLTLAPRATAVGLHVRTLDGRTSYPEESMRDGELLLFAGDALSYLTAGSVPALMHEVVPHHTDARPERANGVAPPTPRLSAPLFLRGARGRVLRPPPPLPPLPIETFERNPGNLRSSWPWKAQGPLAAYYGGMSWHPDLTASQQQLQALT